MPFKRGPRAERDDRSTVPGAQLDNCRDLFGTVNEGDRVRSMRRVIGFVSPVLIADPRRSRESIAEQLAQRGQQRLLDRLAMKGGCIHGSGQKIEA